MIILLACIQPDFNYTVVKSLDVVGIRIYEIYDKETYIFLKNFFRKTVSLFITFMSSE